MAEVALRDYLDEIDNLIDHGSVEAALQHSRHILQQYPKVVDVYRLMGKALLEREDDRAAQDVFQRVLSVDPEDFVARVGLSIVHDRNNELELAIWHMERAFDIAPSNALIQGELRRLYARRDGESPERIPLTRDALARMYAQGDLNAEAIADLRDLLREQPDRLDLQIQMVEVLWRDEQRVEAAELAQKVLVSLPYCLKANLIMGALLQDSEADGESDEPLQCAQAVDPENLFAVNFLGVQSVLAYRTVMLDRLDLQTVSDRLDATDLVEPAEDVPEWLRGISDLEPPLLPESEAAHAPRLSTGLHMPDVTTEVPDWLQGLTAEPSAAEATVPDWLATLTGAAVAGAAAYALTDREQPETEESVVHPADEVVPDWINQLGDTGRLTDRETISPVVEDEQPAWMAQFSETQPAPFSETIPTAEDSETPDWLKALAGAAVVGAAAHAVTEGEESAPEEVVIEPTAEEAPDWTNQAGTAGAFREPETITPVVEDEQPAWLAQFSETQPAPFSETIPTAEDTETPDWLKALAGAAVVGAAAHAVTEGEEAAPEESVVELTAEETPDWTDQTGMAGALTEPETAIADEQPAWLAQFSETPPAPFSETISTAEDTETPDWLKALAGAAVVGAAAHAVTEGEEAAPEESVVELAAEETPDWTDQTGMAGALTEPETLIVDEQPAWLAQFSETPPAPFSETISTAEDTETPDWLKALAGAAVVGAAAHGVTEGEEADREESVVEPPAEVLSVPAAAPEIPEEMPSADDALAFFAKLAAGKEDQLRAEAQADADVRMAEIMGRKPAEPKSVAPAEDGKPVIRLATTGAAAAGVVAAATKLKNKLEEPEQPEATVTPAVSVEPTPEVPEEMPSADDALAFLAKLAAGKEDQLRADAEREADVRMAAIMGRKPVEPVAEIEVQAPPPVEPLAAAESAAEVPEEMPSADDALAFFAKLAAGKEDQLRAQAQLEAESRMDAIMGRKPVAAPTPAAEEKPGVGLAAAALGAAAVAGLAATKKEEPAKPVEPVAEVPETMPSADDALAFLAKLAAGKEDQLRAQAEQDAEVRMAAIMGRSAPVEPAKPIETELPPVLEIETESAEEGTDWIADLSASAVAEPVPADDLPDWLKQMRPPEETLEPASELPEWLKAMRPADTDGSAGLVAMFEEEEATEELEAAVPTAEIPAWLLSMQPGAESEGSTLEALTTEEEEPEPVVTPAAELPDWLKQMRPAETAEEAEVTSAEEEQSLPLGALAGAAAFGLAATMGEEEPASEEPTTDESVSRTGRIGACGIRGGGRTGLGRDCLVA